MIAFRYHRRWDEEKYFDNYKTDMANSKAWGKSPIAIEQQALLGLVTHILMRLFLHKKGEELGLEEDHQTQQKRHEKKKQITLLTGTATIIGLFSRSSLKSPNRLGGS